MTEWKVSEIYEPKAERDVDNIAAGSSRELAITQWAEDERPREKLLAHGAAALSTAELMAILIGSGSQKESAVSLMKRLMNDCQNSLAMLSRMGIAALQQYNGIGEAKAVTILAACELGRRREKEEKPQPTRLADPRAIYDYLYLRIRDLDVEEAYVVLMNPAFKPLRTVCLSHGGLTETAVDVRVVIREALLAGATVLALAHNHPSGNLNPSRGDDAITRQLQEACSVMRIYFLDHLVLADGGYYSYRDHGKL